MSKRSLHHAVTRSVAAIIVCLPPLEEADAYLDPGTGGVLLQVGIAAFVGGLFAVKVFWSRIRSFLWGLLVRATRQHTGEE